MTRKSTGPHEQFQGSDNDNPSPSNMPLMDRYSLRYQSGQVAGCPFYFPLHRAHLASVRTVMSSRVGLLLFVGFARLPPLVRAFSLL